MAVTGLGRIGFEDVSIPAFGKSEFGMDTLVRTMQGHSELLLDFLASLHQGDTHAIGDNFFYLQSWEPDKATPVSTVTLNYKGLSQGGTPTPDISTEVVSTMGRMQRSYLGFNGGLGITVRNREGGSIGVVNPVSGAVERQLVLTSPVYTVSATLEFTYHAVESRYRYVTTGRPSGPRYTEVESDYVPAPEEMRITTSDGATYGRGQLLAFNMTPELHTRVVAWTNRSVIGSPYFEVEEVVRLELVDPEEFP